MCGIVGIAGKQDLRWLTSMNALVEHRGPDDSCEYRDPESDVGLAMRRLSIIDLSGGQQPMSNEDKTVWIVYNGEIYNAPEIRKDLIAKGHRFQTSHSDTEVLVHLYEEKRDLMIQDLNGMFAFVIYDKNLKLLFGARDRVGIKPLYYTLKRGVFAFASELKCFSSLPWMDFEIDMRSLYDYMSLLYIPAGKSILKNVERLPSGHWFKFDLSSRKLTNRKYWDIDVHNQEQHSEAEWCEMIRAELKAAIRRRTVSDVPIACSLSGGIDSSTIVGLLSDSGYSPLKTYSLGFDAPKEADWNELPLAKEVALQWKTDHHELILKPDDLMSDLIKMVWHLDEPYGGGLPSWYVFRFMSRDVKVSLIGTGGDDLFGNYSKYKLFEMSKLARYASAYKKYFGFNSRFVSRAWGPIEYIIKKIPNTWLAVHRKQQLIDLPSILRDPLEYYFFCNSYYFSDEIKHNLVFQMEMDESFDTWNRLKKIYDSAGTEDLRDGIAYMDFKTQLSDEFLFMTDRLSMAHSIEARVPFLDHNLIELIFRIPPSIRTRLDNPKYLLKQAVGSLIPQEVLKAKKRGFVIPVKLWLRNELRPLTERLLSPHRLGRQGIFRPEFYNQFVRPHIEGKADYTCQIWAALMFQLWHLIFIEEKVNATPSFSWKDII